MPFTTQHQNTNQQEDNPLNQLTGWMKKRKNITLIFVFGTLVVTCQQNQIMREALRMDQRAWVGVTEVGNSTIEKGAPIQLDVTIQGNGGTPAVNVKIKTVWSIFQKKDGFCPWYGNNPSQAEDSKAVIFPGQKNFLSTILQSLDPEFIARLETGDMVLYHYGTIDYDDVFDPPTAHCTTFCYVYNRDLKMPHPCGTYNKVTDTKCEAGCPAPPGVLKRIVTHPLPPSHWE